jgi:hypothetical protein
VLRQGLLFVLLVLVVVGAAASQAAAQPGLLLGVTDDSLRWTQKQGTIQRALTDLGLGAIRFTQTWKPGETKITQADATSLGHAITGARGLRVVLSVYGAAATDAPQTDAARAQYCTYVRSIVLRFPQVRDLVIWNEVNSSAFWAPQSGAPAAYEALLAACYGPLHTARVGVNVISSLAPRGTPVVSFLHGMGDAYRASGRAVKIFDTFGQNAYPRTSVERPWRWHDAAADVSQGDYARLIVALHEAFDGSGQPLPGVGGVTVWYLEDGFQTAVPRAKAGSYRGRETDRSALPPLAPLRDTAAPDALSAAPDQATQLADAIKLAYCQPGVGAFFNFMLADEVELGGWQSGVLWSDWTPKPSFAALTAVVREVQAGAVDCAKLKGGAAGGVRPPA